MMPATPKTENYVVQIHRPVGVSRDQMEEHIKDALVFLGGYYEDERPVVPPPTLVRRMASTCKWW